MWVEDFFSLEHGSPTKRHANVGAARQCLAKFNRSHRLRNDMKRRSQDVSVVSSCCFCHVIWRTWGFWLESQWTAKKHSEMQTTWQLHHQLRQFERSLAQAHPMSVGLGAGRRCAGISIQASQSCYGAGSAGSYQFNVQVLVNISHYYVPGWTFHLKNMWFQDTFNFNSSFFSLNRRSPSNAESLGRP